MGCVEITMCGKIYHNDKLKKMSNHSAGYKVVWLNNKLQYVHRLVAEKYISNPNKKIQVNHKNGIKTDNRVCNLEWVTSKENNNHAKNTGLWGKNIIEKRKLTPTQVLEIRSKYKKWSYGYQKLANEYQVHYRTIYDLINKNSYKEII